MRVTLVEGLGGSDERPHDIVALDEALEALAAFDERKSRVVELRFFGGLSVVRLRRSDRPGARGCGSLPSGRVPRRCSAKRGLAEPSKST